MCHQYVGVGKHPFEWLHSVSNVLHRILLIHLSFSLTQWVKLMDLRKAQSLPSVACHQEGSVLLHAGEVVHGRQADKLACVLRC